MYLTEQELNLICQWFNAVADLNPKYLEDVDRDLGRRITEHVRADQQLKEAK